MRAFSLIFIFSCSLAFGEESCKEILGKKLSSLEHFSLVLQCQGLESQNLELNWRNLPVCGHTPLRRDNSISCKSLAGGILASCQTPSEDSGIFCFNGISLKRDPANLVLMYHLCNNERLDAGLTLTFGSCTKGQLILTDELRCECLHQGNNKNRPLAFSCRGL